MTESNQEQPTYEKCPYCKDYHPTGTSEQCPMKPRVRAYQNELDRAHQSAENTRLTHLPSVREEED